MAICRKAIRACWISSGCDEGHLDDLEQDLGVARPRPQDGIVGHEAEEQDEHGELQREGHPVDGAPGRVLGDDAGEQAGQEHAEDEAGHDDGDHSGAMLRRGILDREREHELGRAREEADE